MNDGVLAVSGEGDQKSAQIYRLKTGAPVEPTRVRVLMIDDDYEDFVLVKRLLHSVGSYQLHHVDNAVDAERCLRSDQYDIALVDGRISGRSGIDLISTLATPYPNMPMILLTGHGDDVVDEMALQAGAADFIDKKDLSARLLARSIRYARAQFESEKLLRVSEQEMRRAKEEAELASAAKSQFLAHMSHELRTPLNAIIGFSELMLHEILGPVENERYRGYIADIGQSGQHLLDLINDILDLSKIEAGRMAFAYEPVKVSELVAETVKLIGRKAEDGGVELVTDIFVDGVMMLDRRAAKQMLLNLLSNAVKFTKAGGRVTVSFSAVGDNVLLSVTDTGIGIPPEKLTSVMEPFSQVEQELYLSEEGTGLGLPIVKALIEAHDGHLDISSAIGRGTRASLYFPNSRMVD